MPDHSAAPTSWPPIRTYAFSVERLWRIIATTLCFVLFGIGGLLVLCFVFPLLRLTVWPRTIRLRWARDIVCFCFRVFCAIMQGFGVISYEVRGAEKLRRRGLLVIANHPSLIDVVLLMSLLRQPDCVVKASAWRNPFMLGPVTLCGFIRNEDGPRLIDACINSVRAGNNLIIFPEGTRTRLEALANQQANRLQRGTANIALRGHLALTPVIITVSEPMLTKQEPWYRAPLQRPHFVLNVLDDIPASQFTSETTSLPLAARTFTQHLSNFFVREIKKQCLT